MDTTKEAAQSMHTTICFLLSQPLGVAQLVITQLWQFLQQMWLHNSTITKQNYWREGNCRRRGVHIMMVEWRPAVSLQVFP